MNNNIITIQSDGLNAEKIAPYTGGALEVLAAACEFPAYEECRENNFDWMDENMAEAFKRYNHEDALIEALNEAGIKKDNKTNLYKAYAIFDQCGISADDRAGYMIAYAAPDQPLQLGAFMALKYTDAFPDMLEAWKEAQREAMSECLGDYTGRAGLYPPLAKHLQDAYEWAEEYALHEYLHGDRSDYGMLETARRKFALESVRYNKKTGVITLEYDPESPDLQESLPALEDALNDAGVDAYNEDDAKKREAVLASFDWSAAICKYIEDRAARYIAKEKEAAAKRRAENEKIRAYQQQHRDAAEAERIAKLEAMKKTQ